MAKSVTREEVTMTLLAALNNMPINLERHPDGHGGVRAGVVSHSVAALEAAGYITVVD